MDFFDNTNSFNQITERMEKKKSELNKKYNRTILLLIGLFTLLAFGLSLLIYITDNILTATIPLIIYVIFSSITILVKNVYLKSVLRSRYLNAEILSLYNYYENNNFEYNQVKRTDNTFNKEMAMYNRSAGAATAYEITHKDSESYDYRFMDTTLTISTGQSAQVVFDGLYIIIQMNTERDFFIKGRKANTNRKGLKFFNIKHPEYNVYLTGEDFNKNENMVTRPLDSRFYNIFEFSKKVFDNKNVALGSDKKELHIAIPTKLCRKMPKTFSQEDLRVYYDDFVGGLRKVQSIVDFVYGLNS